MQAVLQSDPLLRLLCRQLAKGITPKASIWRLRSTFAQVNVAVREAALSPSAADTLLAFEGAYQTHFLPTAAGHPATKGMELVISSSSGITAIHHTCQKEMRAEDGGSLLRSPGCQVLAALHSAQLGAG